MSNAIVVPLALIFPALAFARTTNAWQAWEYELHRQCPSRHVEWIGDGGYDELLVEFDKTLPPHTRSRILNIAEKEMDRACAGTEGFSCEMSEYLDIFQRLRLLTRFTRFGCTRVKCEEVAICSM